MSRLLFSLFISGRLLVSCKKSSFAKTTAESDELVYKDVKGIVYNICTDSGMAGIPVFLFVFHNNKKEKTYQVISDKTGNFQFLSAELHSDKKYSYNIYIASRSGTMPKDSETCAFTGTSLSFSLEDAEEYKKAHVVPGFTTVEFYYLRDSVTVDSDSVITRFSQEIYHKNRPDFPFKFGDGSLGSRKTYNTGVNSYPMGKYNILVDKWVSGKHTQWKDSIYLKYGHPGSYVVHW